MKIIIRNPKLSDMSEIVAINSSCIPYVDYRDISYFENSINNTNYYFVAECDNKVSGFIIAYDEKQNCDSENYRYFNKIFSDFIYVDRIVVNEKYHGLNIGTQLYKNIGSISGNIKRLTCEVNTNPPNKPSILFHQKIGFKEIDECSLSNGKTVAYLVKEA
jgi:uncharacterized protein